MSGHLFLKKVCEKFGGKKKHRIFALAYKNKGV